MNAQFAPQVSELNLEQILSSDEFRARVQKLKIQWNKFYEVEKVGRKTLFYRRESKSKRRSDESLLLQIYEECGALTSMLRLDGLSQISYAIYYRDAQGKMLRLSFDRIPKEFIAIHRSTKTNSITQLEISSKKLEEFMRTNKTYNDISEHFDKFDAVVQDNKSALGRNIEHGYYGYISEAFERHLAKMHKSLQNTTFNDIISKEEAIALVRQSLGHDPWYSGGDLYTENIQVKSINSMAQINTVRLSTLNSINTVITQLSALASAETPNAEKLALIQKYFQQKTEEIANTQVERENEKVVDDIIKPFKNLTK